MATFLASSTISGVSSFSTPGIVYLVDSAGNITWSVDGSADYAVKPSATNTLIPVLTSQASVSINARSSFTVRVVKSQANSIGQDYAPDDGLTLSIDDNGDWFATLDNFYWSDIGQTSVYPGFRIVCGDGLAIITEDPQYHVRTVAVDIVTSFPAWRMLSQQWHLYIPLGTDFNRSVDTPNYFRTSDLLTAVMNDFRKFVVSESQYLTRRAGDLRKWNKIPSEFIEQLLATLGCYLRLDRLDSEGRRRLAFEWIRFLQYAGTKYFIDFLGYVYDTHFDVKACWTKDYRSFPFPDDIIDVIDDDGDEVATLVKDIPGYYPTNHVAITYNADDWNMDDLDQWTLIIDTFYKLASVPLVLQALAAKRSSTVTMWLAVADQTSHKYFSWSPPLVIASTTLYLTMVDHRRLHRESHSPPLQLNFSTLYMVMVDHVHRERFSHSPLLEI